MKGFIFMKKIYNFVEEYWPGIIAAIVIFSAVVGALYMGYLVLFHFSYYGPLIGIVSGVIFTRSEFAILTDGLSAFNNFIERKTKKLDEIFDEHNK